MSRITRTVIPSFPHHVVTRGNNGRRLFSYRRDQRQLCLYVGDALQESGCALHAMTLMTNHVHLVVTPPHETALAAFVKSFAQHYAQYRNWRKRASGKLWQERYWSDTILGDYQLGVVTIYADANPVRAGLVGDGAAYPWSTAAIHAGEPERCAIPLELWTPSTWYSGLGSDTATRAARYRELLEVYRQERIVPEQAARIEALESAARRGRDEYRIRRPDGMRAEDGDPGPWE